MASFLSNGALTEEVQTITVSSSTYNLTVDSPTCIQLTGSGSQTFKILDARTLVPGIRFFIGNRTDSISVVNYPDTTEMVEIVPNSQVELRLIYNSTQNGTWDIAFAGGGTIGAAEDGDYTDGLFTDFIPTTPIGTPIDRFNEVLKQLAPSPAPNLSLASLSVSGVTARLSFDGFHIISGYAPVTTAAGNAAVAINGLYSVSGTRRGSFAGTTRTGVIASGSPSSSAGAYPANSFGSADTGTLQLEVNGVVVQMVDLSIFGAGSSTNGNGSGFTLSAPTSVLFPNLQPFSIFKYRTGTFFVTLADLRLGFNYVRLNHNFNSVNHYTNYAEWVVDTEPTALTAASGSLHGLNMTGLRYLSGVAYHTGGTALYDVTINNAQKDIYSDGSIVTFSGSSCSVPAQALPAVVTPNWELAPVVITNAVATVSNVRMLNAPISVAVNCAHPLKAALSAAQSSSITGLLMDPILTASTDLHEGFDLENIRIRTVAYSGVNNYAAQADVSSGTWDSQQLLTTGSIGYTDGLLYYNSLCCYPTQGVLSGNFGSVVNGPAGNPNYSAVSGTRYLYFKIRNSSGSTRSNLTATLTGTGSFVSVATGPSGQNLTLEMKFPAGSISTATGWMDCYSDFFTDTWADGSGCRQSTNGVGRAFGTTWGITIGTKSIAANEYLVFRLAASSAWTGSVSDILVAFI